MIDELRDIASVRGIDVEPEHEISLANMLSHHLHTHTQQSSEKHAQGAALSNARVHTPFPKHVRNQGVKVEDWNRSMQRDAAWGSNRCTVACAQQCCVHHMRGHCSTGCAVGSSLQRCRETLGGRAVL